MIYFDELDRHLTDISHYHTSTEQMLMRAAHLARRLLQRKPRYDSLLPHLCRRDLPYAVLCADGRKMPGIQILLNRHYKPLGNPNYSPFVNYAQFGMHLVQLTPEELDRISCSPGSHTLYHDGCVPWHGKAFAQQYVERLSLLTELVMPPVDPAETIAGEAALTRV